MLSEHIESQIYNIFFYAPTIQQKKLIKSLSQFVANEDNSRIFVVNGYAGTGKTTIIAALTKVLNSMKINNLLLAPTGRAAKVMSQYSESIANTIHKKIYRQKSASENEFVLSFNKSHETIFIIDEASMISNTSYENVVFGSGRLLDDLFDYIDSGRNCKVIMIGDSAQLPPIGTLLSPALDTSYLENYGTTSSFELNEVVRQQLDSGILYNATIIRELIETNNPQIPVFDMSFKDIKRITGADVLEIIEDSYAKYGTTNTSVIVRSNRNANRFNQGIRARVLYQEEMLDSGDYIMIVKNNYFYKFGEEDQTTVEKQEEMEEFLANGDVAQIRRVRRYQEMYGFRFADVTLKLTYMDDYEMDCKIILDTLESESPALTAEQQQKLFEEVEKDYMHISLKKERYKAMRNDEFLNALQVKFAYALTCHKSQGGQWDCVVIDRVLWGEMPMTMDLLRWLYTAFTRATQKLYLLNFDDRFFTEKLEDL